MSNHKPLNIIFLMTDQQRVDHVSFLPESRWHTPNIDRIAQGVGFSNCVSVNPICTPARSALLTGKYTHQIGMLSMSGDLSQQHPTYLQALKTAGYWTAGVGKFHWLQNWPWGTGPGDGHDLVALREQVKQYGLDYIWEVAGKQLAVPNHCDYCQHLKDKGILDDYRAHIKARGPNAQVPEKTNWTGKPWPFDEEDYVDIVTGNQIVNAIDARPDDQPFFLFGSFCGPHKPYDPPASYIDKTPLDKADDFLPGESEMDNATKQRLYAVRRAYRAMISVIDDQVGIILDKLEEEGLLDSTVILFTSDHGEMLGDRNRMSKGQPWRQSVVVPTAIRHPDHLDKKICDAPVELTDLTATMLDVAGLDPAEALSKPWPAFHDRVPCRSLMPIVKGDSNAVRQYAFSECGGLWQMVQSDQCKYVRYLNHTPDGEVREELYDLQNDPGEQHNLINDPRYIEPCNELRETRTRILDATPPAQTGWAPFLAQK